MSTKKNLCRIDAAFNRLDYSGNDMSNESKDDDDFSPTVTSAFDATDSSDCGAEESEGPSNAGMFMVRNICY